MREYPETKMTGELRSFRRKRLTPEQGKQAADSILQIPITERRGRAAELFLDDPETLLPLLEALRRDWTTAPARVLAEATFVYEFLNGLTPRYPIDAFLLDEREYFLGETARIAGTG
jgi:hypothetical protein